MYSGPILFPPPPVFPSFSRRKFLSIYLLMVGVNCARLVIDWVRIVRRIHASIYTFRRPASLPHYNTLDCVRTRVSVRVSSRALTSQRLRIVQWILMGIDHFNFPRIRMVRKNSLLRVTRSFAAEHYPSRLVYILFVIVLYDCTALIIHALKLFVCIGPRWQNTLNYLCTKCHNHATFHEDIADLLCMLFHYWWVHNIPNLLKILRAERIARTLRKVKKWNRQ